MPKEIIGNKIDMNTSQEKPSISKADDLKMPNMKYPEFLSDAKDGAPPKCIYDAFKNYCPKTASEVMNLLIHLSMIESGFKLCTDDSSSTLPSFWRDIATTLKYSKPSYLLSDSSQPKEMEFACSIVIVTVGPIKQVLASFVGQDSEISAKFDTKQYVLESQLQPENLKRLSHFNRLLRNELLHPLRISAHNILELPAPWHLLGLPYDIMLLILKLLSFKDILNLGLTCTSLKATVDDQRVWFHLFKTDFSSQIKSSDSVDSCQWKERYKSEYLKKKIQAKHDIHAEEILFTNPRYMNPPGAIIFPTHPDLTPYGPATDLFPTGPNLDPFGDPDSTYFGGDLAPNRRGRGIGPFDPSPFPPGPGLGRFDDPSPLLPGPRFGRSGGHGSFPHGPGLGRSGGPRIHFL